jgi:hypothetical protein
MPVVPRGSGYAPDVYRAPKSKENPCRSSVGIERLLKGRTTEMGAEGTRWDE